MGYDSFYGRVEQYTKDKESLNDEFELFSEEELKMQDITSSREIFDLEIQDAFADIENNFVAEKSDLENQRSILDDTRIELSEEINQELEKINDAQRKIDTLLGKKYTGNIENISDRCREHSAELERMLKELDELASEKGSSYSGFDTSLSGKKTNHDTNVIMSRYPAIVGGHSIEMDLLATNPNYSHTDMDSPWNDNCQRCVSAYEARRRGYDVDAQPTPKGMDFLPYMNHPQGWPTVYQGGQLIDCSANSGTAAAMNIEEQMKSWGENARAIVRVRWKPECGSGGHVFIAECENGKLRYVDPQVGIEDASSHFNFVQGSGVFCMRIDNLPFTDKIHQCCKTRSN